MIFILYLNHTFFEKKLYILSGTIYNRFSFVSDGKFGIIFKHGLCAFGEREMMLLMK